MQLNAAAAELTTAATDGILALLSIACIGVFWISRRNHDHGRVFLWSSVFLLLAAGAILGAVAHGLELPQTARFWVWQPLFLSVSLVVSLFVVVATVDALGEKALRPSLWIMLPAAMGFYWCTLVGGGGFLLFVIYEGLIYGLLLI